MRDDHRFPDPWIVALILAGLFLGIWTLCTYARPDAALPAPVRSISQ
jgi:ABC-type nitrate/sulfonate/bicarbonate transport system permease component